MKKLILLTVILLCFPVACFADGFAVGANGSLAIYPESGADGSDGNTILNGSGAPSDETDGANGDFYIDTTAYAIYGPKTAGAWGSGTSLNTLMPSGTVNADEIAVFASGTALKALTESEFKTAYNMEAGTDFQAYDADLTTWAGITPSANVQTLLGAADFAAFRASLDLEAGTDFYSVTAADLLFGDKLSIASIDDTPADDADVPVSSKWLYDNIGTAISANIKELLGSADYATARTYLNVEDGADVTDSTNVQASGARMDSEYTSAALTVDDTPEQITITSGSWVDERLLSGDADGREIELLETGAATGEIIRARNVDDADTYHVDDASGNVENPNNKTIYIAPGEYGEWMFVTDRWYYTGGGTYDLVIGTIQANDNVVTDADGIALTAAQMRSIVYMTGAGDVDIPDGECDAAADVGNWVCVKTTANDQNSLTSLDASNQFITSTPTELTAGNELDIDGNMVCVECLAAEKWYVTSEMGGICTDGGAAD